VRGGGGAGPRLRPSASRRLGVGLPLPVVRIGGLASTAGSGSESVVPELVLPRRNLTLPSLGATGALLALQVDMPPSDSRNHPSTAGVRVEWEQPSVPSADIQGRTMTVDNAAGTQVPTHGVELTDAAAAKAKALLDQEGRNDMNLRIAVQPGGCAGLRYQLFFDERTLDGDAKRDFDGLGVVVDRMSAPYLQGAVIDFVDTIEKQGFTIDNPNAGGSCACGDSFN
jgi:iron-sulfur cluster assembly accessory protein